MALLQAGCVEVRGIFERLFRDARRDPHVWHLLTACHGLLDDHIQSQVYARKTLVFLPSLASAWSNLGSAFYTQSKSTETKDSFREAVKWAPTDTQAHTSPGNVIPKLKRTVEVELYYREANRNQLNFPDALTNLQVFMQDCEEMAEAVAMHRQTLALNAQHMDALYNPGYALMLLGDPKSVAGLRRRPTPAILKDRLFRPSQTCTVSLAFAGRPNSDCGSTWTDVSSSHE